MAKDNEITTRTIKVPQFSYVHLELTTQPLTGANPDILTIRRFLTASLSEFLGLMGSAVAFDILKVEGQECWVRTARQDLTTVVAAAGGWVGGDQDVDQVSWRVKGSGNWLGSMARSCNGTQVWAS